MATKAWDKRVRSMPRAIEKKITTRGTTPIRAEVSQEEFLSRKFEIRKRIIQKQTTYDIWEWQRLKWGYSWDRFTGMVQEVKALPLEVLDPDLQKDFEKDIKWLEGEYQFYRDAGHIEAATKISEMLMKIKGRYVGKSGNLSLSIGPTDSPETSNLSESQLLQKIEELRAKRGAVALNPAPPTVPQPLPTQSAPVEPPTAFKLDGIFD